MRLNKRVVLRVFLGIEIVVFLFFYCISPNGLPLLKKREQENKVIQKCIAQLEKEIEMIEQETNEWEDDSFYKERIAREQLYMARPDDEVYVIV